MSQSIEFVESVKSIDPIKSIKFIESIKFIQSIEFDESIESIQFIKRVYILSLTRRRQLINSSQLMHAVYSFSIQLWKCQQRCLFLLHVLLLFLRDVAFATDFCAYWKRFSRAGIQTTCLSGTDISTTVNIYKTLKFGREDLNRPRQDVFTRHEANGPESRFYELIQRQMFKRRILSWFEDIKSSARKGDRIVIILCAHG